jgi:hypothetical protein
MQKATLIIPMVKRTAIKKAVIKGDTVTFIANNKKKTTIPLENLQYMDSKTIIYNLPMRKIVKSEEFETKKGIVSDGTITFPVSNMTVLEEIKAQKAKKKSKDEEEEKPKKKKKKKKN